MHSGLHFPLKNLLNFRNRHSKQRVVKAPYFRWLLKKFEKFPELSETVSLEQVGEYEEILE
jgi:hypothetical protein